MLDYSPEVKAPVYPIEALITEKSIWTEIEDRIIIDSWEAGIERVLVALRKAGFRRSKVSVVQHSKTLKIDSPVGDWDKAAMCPQMHFYSILCHRYGPRTKDPQLTYPILARMCYVQLEHVQQFFRSGPEQEPMSMQMRHHFWIAVGFAREDRLKKNLIESREKIRKKNEIKATARYYALTS